MRFRDKLANFMSGRYGMDEFGRFLNIITIILLIVSIFCGWVWIAAILVMGYEYFRMFSRNFAARNRENQWYCNIRYRGKGGANGRGHYGSYNNSYGGYNNSYGQGGYSQSQTMTDEQKRAMDRRTHKIFKCPNCTQRIRVPKGKGKICIKCPKCRIEFIKKT